MSDAKIILSAEDKSKAAFDSAIANLGNLHKAADAVKGTLEAVGVTLSAGYFVELIKGAIDSADHLNDLTKSTGLTVEELSGLKLLAKQSGSDLDGLAKGINRMTVEIGKAPDKFRALGVTATDGVGALKQFSDIFNLLPDITQRNALAQAVFQKSWAEMAPILSEGSQKIGETITRGQELSGVTTAMARASDEFNDKITALTSTHGFLNTAVASLLPLLNTLADDLIANQKAAHGADDDFKPLAETFRAIAVVGGNVMFVLRGIGTEIGGLVAQADALGLTLADVLGGPTGMVAGLARAAVTGEASASRFHEIHVQMQADAEANRAAFDKWEQKIMSTRTSLEAVGDTSDALSRKLAAGQRAEAEAAAARAAAFLKNEQDAKDAVAGYDALIKRIQERIDADKQSLALGRDLTESEKFAVKTQTEINALMAKYPGLSRAAAEAKLAEAKAEDAKVEAQRREIANAIYYHNQLTEAQQASADIDKAQRDHSLAVDDELEWRIKAQADVNAQMLLEAQLLGATDKERAVALQLLQIEQARLNEITKITRDNLQLNKDAAIAKVNASAAEASRQVVVKADLQDVIDLTQRLQDLGHTLWDDLWSNGHDKLKKLGDDIKKYLIDELYQLVVKQWVFNIAANVTGGAATGAVQGGSSALMGGASIIGGGGSFGSGLSAGFGSGLSAGFGSLFNEAGIAGGLDAGVTALGAGNILGGLGTLAGVLGPFAAGGALLMSLFGGSKGGPKVEGGSGTGGLASFGDTSTATQAASAIATQYKAVADALGIVNDKIDVGFQFGKDPKGTAQSQLNITGGSYNRASLYGGTYENVGRSDTEFQAEVARASAQLIITNLRDQVSGPVGDFLKSIDITSASLQSMQDALQIAQDVGTFDKSIAALGVAFSGLTNLSVDAKESLIQAAGGMQNLQGELAGFYNDFIPEAEKHDALLQSLVKTFADANVALPTTRDEFTAAVKAAMAAGNTGSLQVLLSTEQAFNQLYPAIDKTAEAASTAADSMGRSLQDIISGMQSLDAQGKSLQVDFLRATGDGTGADALQRSLDTAGLSSAEIALYDYNVALRKSIQAVNDAKAAEQEHARAAAQAAAELASTGLQMIAELQQKNDAFLQKQMGLQQQIWQLTGDTASLRKAELDALEPGLRPMQEYIYKLEDQKAATNASTTSIQKATTASTDAANAANELANAWKGATDSVMGEVARIRGLIVGSDPGALAYVAGQLTIAKAKASAGDINAYKSLPALSQQYLSLYEQNATSSTDLRLVQGRTATGLETLANFVSGGSYSPVSSGSRGTVSGGADVARAINGMAATQEATSTGSASILLEIRNLLQDWAVNGFPATDPQWESA